MADGKNRIVNVVINPRLVLKALLLVTLFLVILHFGLQYSKFYGGPDKLLFFSNIFNVGDESTVPTWFSQLILLGSAVICGFIAYVKRSLKEKYYLQWAIVGFVFLFLSIDEIALIHEQLISTINAMI